MADEKENQLGKQLKYGQRLQVIFTRNERDILKAWMKAQMANITFRADLINQEELESQSTEFLRTFIQAIASNEFDDITRPIYEPITQMLTEISLSRAEQGFTPSETATYIFSLKDTLIDVMQKEYGDDAELLNQVMVVVSKLLDKLGLVTFESYAKGREEFVTKQQAAIAEMATPITLLWENILFLPMIGVIDSKRAQQVMDTVLNKVVDSESKMIIIDILGVPTVDTKVAQHIINITKATKLLGCTTLITGISPNIAQTLVKLGIDLGEVITRATLKDGLSLAYETLNLEVRESRDAVRKRQVAQSRVAG